MARLEGKVAAVTGAGQGIGSVLAGALAKEGAKVVVSCLSDTARTVGEIEAAGGEAIGVHCDVTNADDLAAMVKAGEEAFGPIEILVNNAGLFTNLSPQGFMDIDEDEWDLVMDVNVKGVWLATKAVVPSMRKLGRGKIVNISSGTIFAGAPAFLHYVSSKGAVWAMSRSLSRELGPDNICVNAITPGFVISENVERHQGLDAFKTGSRATRIFQRDMAPEDLIGATLFLSSPDSDFMTGQTVNVDGGKHHW